MKAFTNWQINGKGFAIATAGHYSKLIKTALKWAKTQQLDLKNATYPDLLSFIDYLREEKHLNATKLNQYIVALEHYLHFMNGENNNYVNPAADLRIKGTIKRMPIDAYTRGQLDLFYTDWPVTRAASKRNKIIMGLIVFQGARHRELLKMQVKHFDLEKGTAYIPGSLTSNNRVLQLQPNQIIPIHEYVKQFENTSDILFTGNHMGHFYRQFKRYHPNITGANILRGSLYAHWVKNHNLRQAQYMAGHKLVSSTERYKQDGLEDLQKAIDKFHPLN